MSGQLYLCATPIGNLGDITLRCLEILRSVDLILAEDTRHTRKLLNHYEIQTPLRSFHEHNAHARIPEVLQALQEGQELALVSDAGLPLISDPGAELIAALQQAHVSFTCLPGASAPPTALLLSGLPAIPYTFLGFLPRQQSQRQALLKQYQTLNSTLICFASPHRLLSSLSDIEHIMGDRPLALCRELTKRYEEVHRGSARELLKQFAEQAPRGEMTLVIAGASEESTPRLEGKAEIQARYAELQAAGWHKKNILAQLREESVYNRNEIYRLLHE